MTCDLLRERERTRRGALWALASLRPGDSNASDVLTILDSLDALERDGRPSTDKAFQVSEVRDFVSAKRDNSGIDIVLELDIPQPWRERFLQASIGSTRLVDGPYASDWYKFLTCWESEMQHLDEHRLHAVRPSWIDASGE